MFLLPTGKAGKSYIDEMTRLMNKWLHKVPTQNIAFKIIMIIPSLLLQNPSKSSKSKEHLITLERRLLLWFTGEFY